ncbi:hypothetical protein C0J52_11839 [Blattella germanica]|nr:hypothetical protein C0J52_11839 [Blattella germanica]
MSVQQRKLTVFNCNFRCSTQSGVAEFETLFMERNVSCQYFIIRVQFVNIHHLKIDCGGSGSSGGIMLTISVKVNSESVVRFPMPFFGLYVGSARALSAKLWMQYGVSLPLLNAVTEFTRNSQCDTFTVKCHVPAGIKILQKFGHEVRRDEVCAKAADGGAKSTVCESLLGHPIFHKQ